MIDNTVMRETTERGDVLFNSIGISSSVVRNTSASTSADSVNLFVDFSTTVITELTTTGDCPFDSSWVPSSDTSDLSETSVSLTGKSVDAESLDDTLSTLTLGNTDGINTFVVFEDFTYSDFLFEFLETPINLLGDGSTVNLDFHDV